MVQLLQKINATHFFYLFALGYIIAFFLPSYYIHPLVESAFQEYTASNVKGEEVHIFYGYQCAVLALINILDSPIAFIGSLANLSIFAIFIFQMLRLPGKLKFLKSALVVTCMVSTLIWPIALRLGMMQGYYLWMFCCIGMSIAYSTQKTYQEEFEDQVLDDLQL